MTHELRLTHDALIGFSERLFEPKGFLVDYKEILPNLREFEYTNIMPGISFRVLYSWYLLPGESAFQPLSKWVNFKTDAVIFGRLEPRAETPIHYHIHEENVVAVQGELREVLSGLVAREGADGVRIPPFTAHKWFSKHGCQVALKIPLVFLE